MQVIQVLNNNVIIVNDGYEDLIVLGKGIGFNTSKGDVVNEQLIEKIFQAPTEDVEMQRIISIISHIDNKFFKLSNKIINEVILKTDRKLADTLIIFLAEQIDYLVSQAKLNVFTQNPTWSDIRRQYPVEFDIILNALVEINTENNIYLKKDDAAFLTMFITNRYIDNDNKQFEEFIIHCKAIKDIVYESYDIDINSYAYNRFVSHTNMQIKRLLNNEQLDDNGNTSFLEVLKKQYVIEYSVLEKIIKYYEKNTEYQLNEMEQMYYMMHLATLVGRRD